MARHHPELPRAARAPRHPAELGEKATGVRPTPPHPEKMEGLVGGFQRPGEPVVTPLLSPNQPVTGME